MSGLPPAVRLEITDPSDGRTHVFEGDDEVSVQRQADEFFGIEDANRRGLDEN